MCSSCPAPGASPYERISIRQTKNLILFRFLQEQPLAPLLASGYRTITLVDLRYLSSDQLDQYIDFEDQDVLFLLATPSCSTTVCPCG
ncbi:MAG: hypothetical protein ACLT9P_06615 [Evtepia gabavorous]